MNVTVTNLLTAEDVARRMSPDSMPDAITPSMVTRRMRSGRWPSTKIGHFRGMTEAHVQEAIDIESIAVTIATQAPPASGISPRSKHAQSRRAS